MDEHDNNEDARLIRQTAQGDRASFEKLYDRLSGIVYFTAFKVLNDQTDAEDVTQDVFISVWEKAGLYEPSRGKVLTWAVTLTRNKAIDKLRSVQRRARLQENARQDMLPDAFVSDRKPADDASAQEVGGILRTALVSLTPEQREVIEMAYFGGLTQQQISEKLNQPLGTVKARVRRGLMKLKEIVGRRL